MSKVAPANDAGLHGQSVGGIHFEQDKANPVLTRAGHIGAEAAKEALPDLPNLLHRGASDDGLVDGGRRLDPQNAGVSAFRGQGDGGAAIDFGRIDKVEDVQFKDLENAVHGLDAESAAAVEEVGDVGLAKAGFFGQSNAGQPARANSAGNNRAENVLQRYEVHGNSI